MRRITVSVDGENWKKYAQVKGELLLNYPDERELTFTEFMNIALRKLEATASIIVIERQVKTDA